jgi:hypothetical protein
MRRVARKGAVLVLAVAGLVMVAASGSARVLAITVTTQLSASSVTTGDLVTDQATLGGLSSSATGTVTYSVFTTSDCSGTAVFTSVVNVTNGTAPPSGFFTAGTAGTYQWQAVYRAYPKKTGTPSACGSEPLAVKNRVSLTTQLSSSGVILGDLVTDQATLTGATPDAGGTVTYSAYSTGDCSGTPVFTSAVQASNGSVPASAAFTAGTVGTYQWQAVYGGDAKNQLAASTCGAEPLVVGRTAITTQLSATSVTTGASVTDQAALAGVTPNAGGTVTYSAYPTSSCSATPVFTSQVAVSNGAVPPSDPFTASPAGTYQWVAAYSGDAGNDPAASSCGAETLAVRNVPSLATQLSATTVKKGDPVTDQAILTGATGDAGGTVTYRVYTAGDCSGTAVFTSTVPVNNGSAAPSAAFIADPIATYQWQATYSGDAKNENVVSACGAEPLAVHADTMVPLMDMSTTTTYYGFQGGLYENGSNVVPTDHAAIGLQRANQVIPLAADGTPSPGGKIVLISMGASSMSQEWCGVAHGCSTPSSPSFMSFAAADPTVNHTTLTIVNGAQASQDAGKWTNPNNLQSYGTALTRLTDAGVTEKQVEAVWFKDTDIGATSSLPSPSADAYSLEKTFGAVLRAIKVRYPNTREVFFSSRIYGGYIVASENVVPEPYAYENGYGVKWVIQAQIDEERTGVVNPLTGDLNPNTVAPWAGWASYLWANGTTPRSDGLIWERKDFEKDGEHPTTSGRTKVANMLMTFFLNSQFTRCWFTNTGSPCA